MKLVCLNVFGGKYYESLMKFVADQAKDTDVFCFQEVLRAGINTKTKSEFRINIFSDLKGILRNFNGYFAVIQKNFEIYESVDGDIYFCQAIFIRKSLKVKNHRYDTVHKGEEIISDPRLDIPRILQHIQVEARQPLHIFNFHGLSTWPKKDTKERINQSERIKNILDKFKSNKIICGDFNMDPDTESVKIIENNMKNLIKDFNIKSTRPTSLNFKRSVSDYVIVSKDIDVEEFCVMDTKVSDHLPIIVRFNFKNSEST